MTDSAANVAQVDTNNNNDDAAPRRYIYNQADMELFRHHSPARKELLSFVTAMGRGLTTTTTNGCNAASESATKLLPHGGYHSHKPLANLTPALASLHGSLTCMSQTWMDPNSEDGIPLDHTVKARFGNPAFRTWHAQLVERSYAIVRCLMECHVKYSQTCTTTKGSTTGDDVNCNMNENKTKEEILKECSEQGYRAATKEGLTLWKKPKDSDTSSPPSKEEEIIIELRAYLHDAFGHPIRLDYGTGHESSFAVLLLSLCKIGCFKWGDGSGGTTNKKETPPEAISLCSLSLFHAYLNVTRGLQRDYMLEPAGSHGVWGLDDYHCIPFYLGACQMTAREQWQQQNLQQQKKSGMKSIASQESDMEDEAAKRMPDNPYLPSTAPSPVTDQSAPVHSILPDDHDHWTPSVIHDKPILQTRHETYIYLSCIRFIQQIKSGVPFFESSPMLNDISHLESWTKLSAGLIRLYEGEVLDKMPVVQHFVFGKIFSANWTPSRTTPLEAPKSTFVGSGECCVAPWATRDGGSGGAGGGANYPGGMPPTRAPWAK